MIINKKLISTLVITGMVCKILPINAIAAETNTVLPPKPFGAIPNESQIKYHEEELAAFIHFGMNTFTNSEWGNGKENPNTFNPTDLDAEEWVKTLKDAGFKRLIMVGKHHDGFAIWKSQVTEHDIEKSIDWQGTKGGNGDVLEEVSKACTKYNMDMGIYLSPWDVNAPSYGYGRGTDDSNDSNGDYNEFYMAQLKEILGNNKYGNNGRFVEVWMDGAKGSGASAQHYKFEDWFKLIEELEPGAVVFSPYGSTVRWIGNESGKAGDPAWSKLNQKRVRDRYNSGEGDDNNYLNNGDANGDIWSVGECDVSLTSGWFWHPGNGPKTMDQLTEIYFSSVGRGQPLLLNIAPDRTGHFTSEDIARINEFSTAIKNSFSKNLVNPTASTATATSVRGNRNDYNANNVLDNNNDTYWAMNDGETTGSITIDLNEEKTFDIVSIEEYIKLGQRISKFSVEVYSKGAWRNFGSGYTIGAKRLVRGAAVNASKIRINIEGSLDVPLIKNIGVYKADKAFEVKSIVPPGTEFIDNVDFENKSNWIQENIGIGNTGMYSATTGNHASFTFIGSKAWVVGTFDPGHGIMEVWVDNKKVSDVDTYKATRAVSQILYETDDLEYGTHTVKLVIKGQKNMASRGNFIGLDCAYYLNNNASGVFEIENTNYTVDEGKSKEITIKRVGGTNGEATVHFSTSPDSAVHGRHYNDVNETINFKDGQKTATVSVSTIDNTEKSGNVKFYCNIDSPSNDALIGFNNKSEVIIIDNDFDNPYNQDNPIILSNIPTTIEAEKLEIAGVGGEIENKDGANSGKVIGWLGLTSRGNAWLNMWVNSKEDALYDVEIRYLSGANNILYYENIDKSIIGTLACDKTDPNFETKTIRISLKKGLDRIKLFNDTESTANIDTIKISKVAIDVDKSKLQELKALVEKAKAIEADKYTSESVANLEALIAKAEEVIQNEKATQEDVNKVKEELLSGIEDLVEDNSSNNNNNGNNNSNNNGNNNNSSNNNDNSSGNSGNDNNNSNGDNNNSNNSGNNDNNNSNNINNSNINNSNSNKLPNTGSEVGHLSSVLGVMLSGVGAVLFKKRKRI